MKVKDLISFLEKQDPEMLVVYTKYSDQLLLEVDSFNIEELCVARSDGWVQNWRKDIPTVEYLVIDGN